MGRMAISESEILNAIVVSGATSRGDLCQILGLSKAAVTQVVNRLLDRKLLIEGQLLQENRVGRKTRMLFVKPDLGYFLGTDLEGLAIRVCLMDCSGAIAASAKRAIAAKCSKAWILNNWKEVVADLLNRSGINHKKIVGLGAGLPGMINKEKMSTRAYLPPGKWVDFDISSFRNEFGFEIAAHNNVVCVSEYERKTGVAVGMDDFICILARYGIGASIYSNGLLTAGSGLSTAELGHMRLDLKGRDCICGQKGCLDVYASGRTWKPKEGSSEVLFSRRLESRGRYLGVAVANVLKLFHPPLVIINGIYNDYEHIVRPAIVKTLDDQLQGLKIPVPKVIFGAPVELKASIGAAMQAANTFFMNYLNKRILDGKL